MSNIVSAQTKNETCKERWAFSAQCCDSHSIPRTLALTIYGDLDLSIIDEMPAGRKKVITEIIPENKRDDAYKKIREELKSERWLYVICPKIGEELGQNWSQEDLQADGAEQRKTQQGFYFVLTEWFVRAPNVNIAKIKERHFPEYEIATMHSKMSKQKKEQVMKDFWGLKLIFSFRPLKGFTPEVGVNVPNATVIIIEGARDLGSLSFTKLKVGLFVQHIQSYWYLLQMQRLTDAIDRLEGFNKSFKWFWTCRIRFAASLELGFYLETNNGELAILLWKLW